jgi:hypothetical protein
MFNPKYSITHLIVDYILKYELSVSRINNTLLPATHKEELIDKLHAEDIDKLGELIGHSIGYSRALDAQRGKLLPTARSKFKVFVNYRSTHDFINTYKANSFVKPSIELSVHLNKLLLKDLVDDWERGKLRGFSDKPNELYDTWYSHRDFYPNLNINNHFSKVFSWIEQPKTKVHKLIQLSILLYEFMDKAPFLAGNQITGILTVATITKEYGLNPNNMFPFVKSIEFVNSDIESAFKMSKSKFVEAVLYTLSLMALDVENQVTDLMDNKVKGHNKLKAEFNDRQLKVLDYLQVEKRITRKEYTKLMGVSFMTSFRDLQELLEKDHIEQRGTGRGTYYTLKGKGVKEEKKEKLEVFRD